MPSPFTCAITTPNQFAALERLSGRQWKPTLNCRTRSPGASDRAERRIGSFAAAGTTFDRNGDVLIGASENGQVEEETDEDDEGEPDGEEDDGKQGQDDGVQQRDMIDVDEFDPFEDDLDDLMEWAEERAHRVQHQRQ